MRRQPPPLRRRASSIARWLATQSDTPPDWKSMSTTERIEFLRDGFAADVSAKTMGEYLGVPRGSLLRWAWMRGFTARNAPLWTPELGARIVAKRPKKRYPRQPKLPANPRETRAKRRRKLHNDAVDPATREAVDRLNALPYSDMDIAEVMGVSMRRISSWRNGVHVARPFSLSLVDETVRRLSRG